MFLKEANQMFAWNAAVLRARNTIAAKSSGIEPLRNRSRGNFADLCYLSSSEDRLHGRALQSILTSQFSVSS